MKALFTYILLFAFAFRPMYIIGYIGYFELNIDYIIDTYCINKDNPELQCNGKCHLTSQINVVTTSEDNQNTYTIVEAFFPVYFQTNCLSVEGKKDFTGLTEHKFKYNIPHYNSPDFNLEIPPKLS